MAWSTFTETTKSYKSNKQITYPPPPPSPNLAQHREPVVLQGYVRATPYQKTSECLQNKKRKRRNYGLPLGRILLVSKLHLSWQESRQQDWHVVLSKVKKALISLKLATLPLARLHFPLLSD